jgi:hypothetical protein
MIEWLSDSYGVLVNAIVLSYVKTQGGEELLTRTSIISEEIEKEKRRKGKTFKINRSDEPGHHDPDELKRLLSEYLAGEKVTNKRMRQIVFPALLKSQVLTRDQLKKAFIDFDPTDDESKIGFYLSVVSSQFGLAKNDFLRQVVHYEYPRHHYEKDNFSINAAYHELAAQVIRELENA